MWSEYTVTTWHSYTVCGTGRMISQRTYRARSLSEALDKAEAAAIRRNRSRQPGHPEEERFLTCNGHIRTC